MVAPDQKTFAYLKGRPYAPAGAAFDQAVEEWSTLTTDDGAEYQQDVRLDGARIAPVVTWGTSPEDTLPIDASVPDPAREPNAERASYLRGALDYMGIAPGKKLTEIAVDRVFIGSCTNSRIEDLRAAAAVLSGRTSKVPGLVSAGSSLIKQQAEQEGLDRIFRQAGLEWGESGCSMCVGMVERIGEPQSLIKIGLCALIAGRDLVSDGAEAGPQRRLGVGEGRRGAGGAHRRAGYLGLYQSEQHIRRAGWHRAVADRKIQV